MYFVQLCQIIIVSYRWKRTYIITAVNEERIPIAIDSKLAIQFTMVNLPVANVVKYSDGV